MNHAVGAGHNCGLGNVSYYSIQILRILIFGRCRDDEKFISLHRVPWSW
jgi:hypothetical protein